MQIYDGHNTNCKPQNMNTVLPTSRNNSDTLSLPQASRMLGITRQRVLQLVEAGLLEADYDVVFHYRRWRIGKSGVQSRLDWMLSVGRKVLA